MNEQKKMVARLKARIIFVISMFFLAFFFLIGKVSYIKTAKGEEYEKKARVQQVNKYDQIIKPMRGSIVDRNKQSLAVSTVVYNVILDPRVLDQVKTKFLNRENKENMYDEQARTIDSISSVLGIDKALLLSYVETDANGALIHDKSYVPIAKKIPRSTAEKLRKLNLLGVWLEDDSVRTYVHDSLAAHVLGFMRGDNQWGLEKYYNAELSGVPGRAFIVFEDGNTVSNQLIEPIPGYTLVTTIDQAIQQYAEDAVMAAAREYTPQNTAVIVMNPNTGEIYAMADYPSINPNDPTTPIFVPSDERYFNWENLPEKELSDLMNRTWTNYNVTSTFEMGSIFKPMVAAAAIDEDIITLTEGFYCAGGKELYDRYIGCWNTYGHGMQSLEDTLAQSCNVAFMNIGLRMGRDVFYKYQRDFGFGENTDIDLPVEESGVNVLYPKEKLNPVELATSAFGQSFNCTPIQAITAFAAVINGGNLMKPYIVAQIVDSDGNVVRENSPTVHRKVISKQTSDIIKGYLRSVVDSPTGTGKNVHIDGYAIGGKTGTGEQSKRGSGEHVLSFIGFLPVDNPQIVAMALINRPKDYDDTQSGGASAAPMLKGLLENIIRYMNIEPSYAFDESNDSPGETPFVTVEDYTDLSVIDASKKIINSGLKYEIVGGGNVVSNQTIKEGTEVAPLSVVTLYATKDDGVTSETVQVPDVLGLSFDEAVEIIIDASLSPISQSGESGKVIEQNPQAGIQAEKGSELVLTLE